MPGGRALSEDMPDKITDYKIVEGRPGGYPLGRTLTAKKQRERMDRGEFSPEYQERQMVSNFRKNSKMRKQIKD